MDITVLKTIYDKLGDDLSKELFKTRLMYTITKDVRWFADSIKSLTWGSDFLDTLQKCFTENEVVVFGAGNWGNALTITFPNYPWKCCIDNNRKQSDLNGIPIVNAKDFLSNYNGEYIIIMSRVNFKEMYEQLIKAHIPSNKIINIGKFANDLAMQQYFDLEYLYPSEGKEIFVDVGSYDGLTSVCFSKWCKKDAKVYAFEPDSKNREKCLENIAPTGIEYQIIPKGAWNERTTLHFVAKGTGNSCVSTEGEEKIETITIDEVVGDEGATFIKMDIEGVEYEALLGAEKTIRKHKPKLAICIYHKPEDVWKLPHLILQFNPDYKFYIRHYSMTRDETVLYAL